MGESRIVGFEQFEEEGVEEIAGFGDEESETGVWKLDGPERNRAAGANELARIRFGEDRRAGGAAAGSAEGGMRHERRF